MDSAIASVRCSCVRLFFGGAALASLDCCSFSFLILAFVGALQLYTSPSSTCDAVAETLNTIPGVSGVDCWVRTLSVVLLLRTLWPLLFDAVLPGACCWQRSADTLQC